MSTHREPANDLSRRRLLQLSAAAASGSVVSMHLTGSGAAKQDATPESGPVDLAAEQILNVASGTAPEENFVFTPMWGGGAQQNWQTLMWMPPMYFDVEGELQPGIFLTWQPNDDFTVWTFSIDPRAKWSDNTPVTATDVKGTWELMVDPLTRHGRITSYIGNVEGFEAAQKTGNAAEMPGLVVIDEQTLEVRLTVPDPVFHWRIATTHMNPVKIEQAAGAVETFWLPENAPAVSGPFMLSAFDPDGRTAQMVPNPNWWRDEGPYLTEINIRFIPDPQIVSALVENGEIDVSLQSLPIALADEYPDFFRKYTAYGFFTFWMNVSAEPTDDINVRKALTHAVNWKDVFVAAYPGGMADRVTQIVDLDLPCVDTENEWYAFDPEAAVAALAESSYGSAERLPKIRVTPRSTHPPTQRALEAIIEFWRQNLGITNVEYKQMPEEFGPNKFKINVNSDDVVIRFPDTATYMWTAAHSEGKIAPPAGEEYAGMLNGYANPDIDALIEEALTLSPEDEARCDLALQAQRLFMEDYPLFLQGDEDLNLSARLYVRNYAKGPDVTLIEPWKIYIAEH